MDMGLPKAIDRNFNLHIAQAPLATEGMRVFESSQLTYVDSGLSCDTFNVIHITRGELLDDQEISEALEYYRSRNLAFCIWVNAENLTANVKAILSAQNLVEQNREVGMALDLTKYSPHDHASFDNIVIVSNAEELSDYASVVAANWNPPDPNIPIFYERTAAQFLDPDVPPALMVYYNAGRAVSTVELFPSDTETIGIYGLATISDQRRKGIGQVLMRFCLKRARALGYKWVVLQASPEGIGIYQRLGFKSITTYHEYAGGI